MSVTGQPENANFLKTGREKVICDFKASFKNLICNRVEANYSLMMCPRTSLAFEADKFNTN